MKKLLTLLLCFALVAGVSWGAGTTKNDIGKTQNIRSDTFVRAEKESATVIASGSVCALAIAETYDRNGDMVAASFTAPVTGIYDLQIHTRAAVPAPGVTSVFLFPRVNGTLYIDGETRENLSATYVGVVHLNVRTFIPLNAGDIVDIVGYVESDGATAHFNSTVFFIKLAE